MELPLILSTFQRRGWGHVRLLSIRAVPAVQMPVEYPRPEQVVRYRNFAAESSTISFGGEWLLSFPTLQNYPLINLIIKPGWLEFLALLHIKKVDHFRVAHIMEISSHILETEFPSPLLRKSQWLQVESAVLLAKSETHAVFLEAVASVAITCAISDA